MINKKKILNEFLLLEIILIFLPISFLFSNILAEALIFSIIFYYASKLNKNELRKIFKNKIFNILIILYLYLIVNYFINFPKDPSALRSFFFIRFPIYAISLSYLIGKTNFNQKKVFTYWTLILIVTCADIQFQSIYGKNFLGFNVVPEGEVNRLGGFMDQELKIANFINNFFIISIGAFVYFNKKNLRNSTLMVILTFFVIYTVYLTGERSNFITLLLVATTFLIFSNLRKIFLIFLLFTSFLIITNYSFIENNLQSHRMITSNIETIKKNIFTTNEINEVKKGFLYKENQYFAHYSTAFQIFKDHPIFGVGLKNFRHYSGLDKYDQYVYPKYRGRNHTTHPHNTYFEIISELGIIGFLIFFGSFFYIFFLFLKFAFYQKNIFIFGNTVMLMSFFIPLLPKGSFFTNWNAMIFWTVFGLNLYLMSQKTNKNINK